MVWLLDEKTKCPDCGTRREEWDPTRGGSMYAYHPSAYICLPCQNVENEYVDRRIKDGKRKGQLPAGLKVRLIPDHVVKEQRRLKHQREIQAKIAKAKGGNLSDDG